MGKFDSNKNLITEVKSKSYEELYDLAAKIRKDLVSCVAKNGGHLASNLGVVELTIALHKVFDTPKDKIIFDVGHQSYVHKMLTGRYDEMESLRNFGGISGFPKREESVHDAFDSGHSGSSIGACFGYAVARDIKHEDYSCVAVIGDGSLTSGVAYEALNYAGESKTPMIVILNDNEKSISDNVGGLNKHLYKLRSSNAYNNFKNSIKSSNSEGLRKNLTKFRDILKYSLVPGAMFEELGFKYFGPINGHSIEDLVEVLSFAKSLHRPVLIHVVTKKGKGFAPAEQNPSKFHGIGKFDPETVTAAPDINPNAWSSIVGNELTSIAKTNDKVVAITAAMTDGTGLREFKINNPDRLFDVGISEQNAVTFAEGLALNGLKPYVCIYSTFLQRAYDQIISEVCLQNLPIVFGIDRAGVTGQDGETHQGQFDIAYLNHVPNMTLLSPRDESMLRAMLRYAANANGPIAIRYPRGNAPKDLRWKTTNVFSPELEIIKEGTDAIIISDGASLNIALDAAEKLDNIKLAVCDIKTIKPLQEEALYKLFDKYKYIFTIEDGSKLGGIGEIIAALSSRKGKNIVHSFAWPDKYIEHGTVDELRKAYHLDAASIAEEIKAVYEEKA